jgi:hypothetical protein
MPRRVAGSSGNLGGTDGVQVGEFEVGGFVGSSSGILGEANLLSAAKAAVTADGFHSGCTVELSLFGYGEFIARKIITTTGTTAIPSQ